MPASAMIVRTLKTVNGLLDIAQRPFDGYIEVTPMCHAVNKEPIGWLRNQFAKEYLDALSIELQICSSNLIQVIKGRGNSLQQGTWVHPYVASRIAQWCHPSFAVQVDKWVLEILAGRSVSPQRPASTQALVDALDAHDAHFLTHDNDIATLKDATAANSKEIDNIKTNVDNIKTNVDNVKTNVVRIEQAYAIEDKRRQTRSQRYNAQHRRDVFREKAYRFAGGRCMNVHCSRSLWLHADEAPTPDDHAQIDHVISVDNGGNLTWDDIQVLCRPCHQRKSLAEKQGRVLDYRSAHPGFIAACARQQREDDLKALARKEQQALPLFDGCCLPLQRPQGQANT